MGWRICFIAGEFPPMRGGLGDYTRELGVSLAQRGHEVHVITRTAAKPSVDTLRSWGLQVHPIMPHWWWRDLPRFLRRLTSLSPDIVHLQYQTAAYDLHPAVNTLFWWIRHRYPHAMTVITYHDLREPYLFPKAGPVRWWITLLPARLAHSVVVTNQEDELVLRAAGLHPTRIPIGPNVHPQPVTPEEIAHWRARWGIPPDAHVVGYFGFLNRSKGVTELIKALREVRAAGWDVHLLMLGEQIGSSDPTNEGYRQEVQQLIHRLDLSSHVHWTGFLPDDVLTCGFALCDVVVLPYRDGASLRRGTLQAALVHGTAIVTTEPRVPVPELVESAALMLVPRNDTRALAIAIQRLLGDPALREQLKQRALALAQKFSWEHIAAEHEGLYNQWHVGQARVTNVSEGSS